MAIERESWTQRLEHLDRRYIFLFVAAGILIPLVAPLRLPVSLTAPVKDFQQTIAALPDGAVVLVAADWDPGSRAELLPITVATLHQLFSRNVRVILLSLWPAGPRMIEQSLSEVTPSYKKEYGKDYVNLGFKEGAEVVMVSLGQGVAETFPLDYYKKPSADLPVLQGIRNYDNIDLVITLSAGYPGTKEWVQQVQERFHKKMISGCAGVSAPEYYPYYQSKQLLGLIGGLKASAEYEVLLGRTGFAVGAMDAQALGHYIIVGFIVLGNVLYLVNRRKPQRGKA
jgi:hypothetical protein